MGANLTRVLVIDVEATCWETMDEQGTMPNEIIEIGICELDPRTGSIGNGSSYVVKPRFSPVSAFCTTLTGWTQEAVDGGRDIKDTIQLVKSDYGLTSNHVWFSCGEYDRIKLGSAGGGSLKALYGIERLQNPFALLRAHYNIKTLFALKFKLKRELGMAGMLAHIKEPLDGRHHNGLADALNIAKLVRAVLS